MKPKLEEMVQRVTESDEDCARELESLGATLGQLQREVRVKRLPVIALFEGWEAAGKGTLINRLALSLDPRGYRVLTVQSVTENERLRPPLYRFWRDLPEPGQIVLYDRSWYDRVWRSLANERLNKLELREACDDIVAFERTLRNQGYLILKLFLQISKQEQARRFRTLLRSRSTAWRIDASDLRQHRHYRRWSRAIERVMARTCADSPFAVIDAEQRQRAALAAFRVTSSALAASVAPGANESTSTPTSVVELSAAPVTASEPNGEADVRPSDAAQSPAEERAAGGALAGVADGGHEPGPLRIGSGPNPLAAVDLSQRLDPEDYERRLTELKRRVRELEYRLYSKRIGVVIGFEGWDAAGKGGSIRRLVSVLDPRGYEVIPISAPTAHEAGMHYLWRFACRLPKGGHISIFDRTWYGRVLVERVEKLTVESQWRNAYDEILAFERHIVRFGHVLVKFWLHIDAEEQLRRFRARESNPEKQWKITSEDWRNREKRAAYEAAVADMIERTSTPDCPWQVIAANDKLFARIAVLQAVADALSTRLES